MTNRPAPTTTEIRQDRPLLTISEAAKQIGVSKTYLYDRANDGELTVVYLGNGRGGQRRVLLEDLERFVHGRRVPAR